MLARKPVWHLTIKPEGASKAIAWIANFGGRCGSAEGAKQLAFIQICLHKSMDGAPDMTEMSCEAAESIEDAGSPNARLNFTYGELAFIQSWACVAGFSVAAGLNLW